mgnify:CR=1 FL=1
MSISVSLDEGTAFNGLYIESMPIIMKDIEIKAVKFNIWVCFLQNGKCKDQYHQIQAKSKIRNINILTNDLVQACKGRGQGGEEGSAEQAES